MKAASCIVFTVFRYFLVLSISNKATAQLRPCVSKGKFLIEAGTAYAHENFSWSIAGNEQGTMPNILSELVFNPIKMAGFFIKGQYRFLPKVSIGATYHHRFAFRGHATDIDYKSDDRTNPVSDLNLKSNIGYAQQAAAIINYHFFENKKFTTHAGIGYSAATHKYHLTDDAHLQLNSTYQTKYAAPYLQWYGSWSAHAAIQVEAALALHYLYYKSEANWNMVSTFQHPVSFRQQATGYGLHYELGLGYVLSSSVMLKLQGSYAYWKTGYGIDELYLTSGETLTTRFNGALQKTASIRLAGAFSF